MTQAQKKKLFGRDFTLMVAGQIISLFGNAILRFALSLYVLDTTGSAAVFGGIGSIPGAMVGGIAIGLCECFVSAIGLSAWKDAVTFAILIIVLLVKPTGFLGRKVQEKV